MIIPMDYVIDEMRIKEFQPINMDRGILKGSPQAIHNMDHGTTNIDDIIDKIPGYNIITSKEVTKKHGEKSITTKGFQYFTQPGNVLDLLQEGNTIIYDLEGKELNENPEILYGLMNFQQDLGVFLDMERYLPENKKLSQLIQVLKKPIIQNVNYAANKLNETHDLGINAFTISNIHKIYGMDNDPKEVNKVVKEDKDVNAVVTYTTALFKK